MLSNGLTLGTYSCQNQLYYGDGLITPHEVVYNIHPDECWDGYLFYVPTHRLYLTPRVRTVRYHVVRKRHINRVRYRGKTYRHKYRHKYRKRPLVYRKRFKRNKPTYIKNRRAMHKRYYGGDKKKRSQKKRKMKNKKKY